MIRRNLRRVLLALVLAVFGSVFAHAQTTPATMPLPNLYKLLTHQTGWLNASRPITPADLEGRIILIDFWTYACINCIHVIPDLHYLEEKFGDKLTVIGVHSAKFNNERDSENIRSAILRYDIRHLVVNDFDFSTWKSFGIKGWPSFVLINPQGMVSATFTGEGNRQKIEQATETLIKQYDGKINTAPLPIALEKDKMPPSVLSFPGRIISAELAGKPALIVADSAHQRIVIMTPDGDITQTIGSGKTGASDGDFATASFNTPQGLAFDNGRLYIADTGNHTLRMADFASGRVTTVAGTGKQGFNRTIQQAPALTTPLASPWDVAFYPDRTHLVIAMAGLHQLWSYDLQAKTVSVIAGNGTESIDDGAYPKNSLSQPSGLSVLGDKLYFVDAETSSLRVYDGTAIKTLIGTGLFDFGYIEGKQGIARMQHPLGLFAADGAVFIADAYNHAIRRYDLASGILTNFAGRGVRGNKNGECTAALFNEPNAITGQGSTLYIADTNNHAIRALNLTSGEVTSLNLREKTTSTRFELSQSLPNADTLPEQTIASVSATPVSILLADGWHINDDAPSYLALFDSNGKSLIGFDKDALKLGHVSLPPLAAGTKARLQATLYYCENKTGAVCLIKSIDAPLLAAKDGKSKLTFKLN